MRLQLSALYPFSPFDDLLFNIHRRIQQRNNNLVPTATLLKFQQQKKLSDVISKYSQEKKVNSFLPSFVVFFVLYCRYNYFKVKTIPIDFLLLYISDFRLTLYPLYVHIFKFLALYIHTPPRHFVYLTKSQMPNKLCFFVDNRPHNLIIR